MTERRSTFKKREAVEMEATPEIDFEIIVLKKGQRAPRYHAIRLTAAAFPPGWTPRLPYHCACGCGKTYYIGDRVAVRNVRKTERSCITMLQAGKAGSRR
jgi:hypothetical protein